MSSAIAGLLPGALIGVGIFITTLARAAVLGARPLQFLLKDHVQLRPEPVSATAWGHGYRAERWLANAI